MKEFFNVDRSSDFAQKWVRHYSLSWWREFDSWCSVLFPRCQRPGRSTTLLLLVVVSPDAIHLALICWWRVESACYCRSCNWTSGHAGGESCACILHLTFLDLRLWCVNKAVDPRLCAGHVCCSWLFNSLVWRHIDMSWLISWNWNLSQPDHLNV